MWEKLKRFWRKKRHPKAFKAQPWVAKPITNEKVMKYHPFFQQDPEKWIGMWLDVLRQSGEDYCKLILADPKCRSTLCIDLLTCELDEGVCFEAPPWHVVQIHGAPIGYFPEKHLVRIVWKDSSGEKQIHQVDVSMIYTGLVEADVIAS